MDILESESFWWPVRLAAPEKLQKRNKEFSESRKTQQPDSIRAVAKKYFKDETELNRFIAEVDFQISEHLNQQKKRAIKMKKPQIAKKQPLKKKLKVKVIKRKGFEESETDKTKIEDVLPEENSIKVVETFNKKDPFVQANQNIQDHRRAKRSSVKLYKALSVKYKLKLVCGACMIKYTVGGSYKYHLKREDDHKCPRDHLAVANKNVSNANEEWSLIRNVVRKFDKLCVQFSSGKDCQEGRFCPYPHTREEKDLWFSHFEKQTPSDFIDDMKRTYLQLIIELEQFYTTHHGIFVEICEQCNKENKENFIFKRKHLSECSNGHSWLKNKKLIFRKPAEDTSYEFKEVHEGSCNDKHCLLYKNVKNMGFSDEEILLKSTSIYQQLNNKNSNKKKFTNRFDHEEFSDSEEDDDDMEVDLEDAYDDINDIKNNIGFPFENIDEDFIDRIYEDYEDNVSGNIDNNPYYQMKFTEELKNILRNFSHNFKKCTINLKGPGRAICEILESESHTSSNGLTKVEIRSRKNCGPCCDRDEVVVELKQTKERCDDSKYVIRGTVVGVLGHSFDRKEYTYLCKVDPYVSHLMLPINGIAPKIHVRRRVHKDGRNKNVVYVYEKTEDGSLELKKSCRLTMEAKETTMFVVKYLRWNFADMYPYGYVCGLLKADKTLEESMSILDVEYQVPPNYDVEDDIETELSTDLIDYDLKGRCDLRDLFTISIDPSNCRDVDDAISVRKVTDEELQVIIHISDVASQIAADSYVDKQACKRMTSLYPADGEVHSMLPKKMSNNSCSLVENKCRNALSVFFKFSYDGNLIELEPEIKETLIINNKKMSYDRAQQIIEGDENGGEEIGLIRFLHRASQKLRKERLQLGWIFCQESDDAFDENKSIEAHQLIEEFMILTNYSVADFLMQVYPNSIPLRVQSPPDPEELDLWWEKWSSIVYGSAYFHQYPELAIPENFRSHFMPVLRDVVKKIDSLVEKGDFKGICREVGMESHHPFHSVALIAWYAIQEKALFVCSGDPAFAEKSHYSLHLPHYAQFTSPIRRYLDIVVHRLVKAALKREVDPPYDCSKIIKLCKKATLIWAQSKKYDKQMKLLKAANFLSLKPIYLPVFVSEIQDNSFSFISPFLPRLTSRLKEIQFNQLSLAEKPDGLNSAGKLIKLIWDKMIYDTDSSISRGAHARNLLMAREILEIDMKRHVYTIDTEMWRNFLEVLNEENWHAVESSWQTLKQIMNNEKQKKIGYSEITSEMRDNQPRLRPHVQFSTTLRKGSVLAVQCGAELYNGCLMPAVKMISITDKHDICIEHKKNPINCFVDRSRHIAHGYYSSIAEYQSIWLPLLAMEAADTAVSAGDSITCNDVPVTLDKENDSYYGSLTLSRQFCKQRKIVLDTPEDDDRGSGDFLCIRFPVENDSDEVNSHKSFIQNKWVCHATVKHSKKTDKKSKNKKTSPQIHLEFRVHSYSCEPPQKLIGDGQDHSCTVEFISKPISEKKMNNSVKSLPGCSKICECIALGHTIDVKDFSFISNDDFNIYCEHESGIYPNNEKQIQVIGNALSQPFTIIQGPPGTGKTVTGIKIAYWFAYNNKKVREEGHVMYCGPSNSSVDVAADWLKRLGPRCPRIARVYGKQLERQLFPVPRYTAQLPSSSRSYELMDEYTEDSIALHHLIRQKGKRYAEEIRKFDNRFRRCLDTPEKISDEELEEYEELLDDASKHELEDYDIILCTCSASASSRLKNIKVYQVIIDECGMCKEPECFIPLVAHKSIEQVVLIGDHRQLQPIVKNREASELGLNKSLFERYKDRAVMLNKQYRMHKKICEFPSTEFYGGNLRTAEGLPFFGGWKYPFWKNPYLPMAFCHIEGAELSLIVSTSEGNEASKSNDIEAHEVTRIYSALGAATDGQYEKILVLSQYRAQCHLITEKLKNYGHANPRVSTVVSSQGSECEFVILSLVRSMPLYEIENNPSEGWCKKNLGFICDEHQINVALTRAKHGLIIIGNKHLLRCNEMWNNLLRSYRKYRCVYDAKDFAASFNRIFEAHIDEKFGIIEEQK